LFSLCCDIDIELEKVFDSFFLESVGSSVSFVRGDEFTEKSPITHMSIPDNITSEMPINVDDCLSDRWRTEMSNVKRLSNISTDIVDDDGLLFLSFLRRQESSALFFGNLDCFVPRNDRKEIQPNIVS
jgi:hypothetical protein